MKKFIALFVLMILTACNPFASNDIQIKDAFSYEVPENFPAGAVFMVIDNNTEVDDRMVDFKTDVAGRVELHTMSNTNNIMSMRRVNDYIIPAGQTHELKPGGDHVMLFKMKQALVAGDKYMGIAVFENAGEVPVTIDIKPRNKGK